MTLAKRSRDESGVALITALLAVMLMSALMVGMFAALATDTRSHAVDRDQTQAYAAAQAGLEKLTSGLASLFTVDVSPSVAQLNQVASTPPAIPNFTFTAPGGTAGSGYNVTWTQNAQGNPVAIASQITTGPYTGFQGLITKYTATVTALSSGGAEVRLRRDIQTVAIPVFQFGVFSDGDLSIFAGDNFSFGGRVHTNRNLFVCEQTNTGTMTFNDRITVVGEVIRNYFANGMLNSTSNPSCTNSVMIPTSPTTNRNLKQSPNEGSVTGMPGTAANPNWTSISTGTYKGYIRTSLTGAKRLDLPLVSQGARPIDLIKRPGLNSNENVANPLVFGQRYFSQASLRILLSDRINDIIGMPTVTVTQPVLLDGNWLAAPPAGYAVGANTPPIARSIGPSPVLTVGGWTGASTTITLAGATPTIPNIFKISDGGVVNQIRVNNVAITCTGKTNNGAPGARFTGCTPWPGIALAAGAPVTAVLPSGVTVQGVTTSALIAIGATIYPVTTTQPFSQNTFFINGNVWTCTNYDTAVNPQTFSGCAGIGAVPANGNAISTLAAANQDTALIGGYIKIEKQDNNGIWTDVTMEILNLGIGGPNLEGNLCADPTPNAILRIQRLRDNGPAPGGCTYANSQNTYDWWPNTLYDPREGSQRSVAANAPMAMAGVMQYISIDVGNLKRWLNGQIGATGTQALNQNGYIVYFSDRRGNHDTTAANVETGEFGFEDQVNPTTANGAPDGTLQTGEDMNEDGVQQTYGILPWNDPANMPAGPAAGGVPTAPYGTGNGSSVIATIPANSNGMARVNKVVLFRRALKIINGGIVGGVNNLPDSGLTIAAENPVYVQGNYNATTDPTAEPNRPAAVIADAITLLSNAWNDTNDFENPNSWANRANAATTGWRFGAVAGRGVTFPFCGAACGNPGDLFGTDGGAANFLHLLEDWSTNGVSLNYRGSLISFATSRQAVGTYKFPQVHIYNGGVRNVNFDTDFLNPTLLPPGTPMFRDVNTLKFRQILRPNQ